MVSPLVWVAAAGLGGLLLLGRKKEAVMTMPPLPGVPATGQPPAVRPPPGPPSMIDLQEAENMSEALATDIASKGRGTNRVDGNVLIQGTGYNQTMLKNFQRLARMTIDGLYGPKSAGALSYFLKRDAPAAIYSDARGRRTAVPYTPPTS